MNYLNILVDMYLDLEIEYQNWEAPKLRVQYEELITNPKELIRNILSFLNISNNNLDNFMDNYNTHKNNSIRVYNKISKSHTNGDQVKFHSNNCSIEQLSILDKMYWSAYNASSLNNRLS